ncbi:hypothetical protein SAY86_029257 [Trapa natans]|uniref:Uncharacterized protein n=1 Tax=Trapa natans TaxID=22666 RepID=A0AAN7M0X7_TRANT|nr:hypothetical protein SAY86_029257 [Trapa natans]
MEAQGKYLQAILDKAHKTASVDIINSFLDRSACWIQPSYLGSGLGQAEWTHTVDPRARVETGPTVTVRNRDLGTRALEVSVL